MCDQDQKQDQDPDEDPHPAKILVHAARYVRLNGVAGDGWWEAVLILRRAYRQVRDEYFGA